MGKRPSYRHVAAQKASKRERGRGLQPDARYLDAIEQNPEARDWLRQQYGSTNLVERLLQQRERGAA
jgi:hypothetical protein